MHGYCQLGRRLPSSPRANFWFAFVMCCLCKIYVSFVFYLLLDGACVRLAVPSVVAEHPSQHVCIFCRTCKLHRFLQLNFCNAVLLRRTQRSKHGFLNVVTHVLLHWSMELHASAQLYA